ncbi:hypothetical protein [Synechocystis sp. PCC 7509]|uniref:hypothetical protein n=1 Tax=Synechocystis sp. PCC 7509 TaxID=927677 RepID=UPI0002AC3E41|nr:hypothetical protein [Synechocystis sp. PCC 7509]
MNYVLKRAIALLFLTAIIILAANFFPVETAKAEVQKPAVVESLSDRVASAVITDLSKQTGISPEKLKITRYSRQTWSNGCLGIAKPDEICTQALVEGWRVVVSGNNRTWVYRSNRNGRIVRLEPAKK